MNKIISTLLLGFMLPIMVAEFMRFDIGHMLCMPIENPVMYLFSYSVTYTCINIIIVLAVYIFTKNIQFEKYITAEILSHSYFVIEVVITCIFFMLGIFEAYTWTEVPTDEITLSHHLNPFLAVFSYVISVMTCLYAHNCQISLKPQS